MADYGYSNIGALLPSEGAFKNPGSYAAYLASQGQQKATYASEMDKFYAQLAETQREFNETLGFKKAALAQEQSQFETELEWKKKETDEEQAQQKWFAEQQIALTSRGLDIKEKSLGKTYLFDSTAPTSREWFDLMKSGVRDKQSRIESNPTDVASALKIDWSQWDRTGVNGSPPSDALSLTPEEKNSMIWLGE